MRLRATVEYEGTDFAGFQLQARSEAQPRTVQAVLEQALLAATGTSSRVIGAGRTDAGVHAAGQVIHFDSDAPLTGDLRRLLSAVNAHLPPDVALRAVSRAPDRFHARHSATSRRYCYRILNAPIRGPLFRRQAYHFRAPLDVARMADGAARLVGSHDFVAFAAQEGQGPTVRRVMSAGVVGYWPDGPLIWHTDRWRHAAETDSAAFRSPPRWQLIEIEVEANAFLRHMMRRIAGTLVRVGAGRLDPADVAAILAAGDKRLAGPTAPALGLCLEHVAYGGEGAAPSYRRQDTETGAEQEEM